MGAGKAKRLYRDRAVRNRLIMCYHNKEFLYIACPDLVAADYLTDLEIELWNCFYGDKRIFPDPKKHR